MEEEKLYVNVNGKAVLSAKALFLQYAQNISLVSRALDSFEWELTRIPHFRQSTSDELLYYGRVRESVRNLENWIAGQTENKHYSLSNTELDDLQKATAFLALICTRTTPRGMRTCFYDILARIRRAAEDENMYLPSNFNQMEKHAQTLRVSSDTASQLIYLLIEERDNLL